MQKIIELKKKLPSPEADPNQENHNSPDVNPKLFGEGEAEDPPREG